ncbi:MAG: glycosyltransferase [Microcoleaceae cyanobacterium]
MVDTLPPIYFYIPSDKVYADYLPTTPEEYWPWQCQHIPPRYGAPYFWILQTFLYLKLYDFPCQLVHDIPETGVILSHRWFFEDSLRPNPQQLFVCVRADVHSQHPYAQLHVVQNLLQVKPRGIQTIWESYYMPHWPQPAIIERDPSRGNQFENIAFFGNQENLQANLSDKLQIELQKLGMNFQTKLTYEEWNDYRAVDVVLAIRGFGTKNNYPGKPASKLYNAWHAGVPAILGYESAFRAERKSDLDYIEVTSAEEIVMALKSLRDNPTLRQSMVEWGHVRAKETDPQEMTNRWIALLTEVAVPACTHWSRRSHLSRQAFFSKRDSYLAARDLIRQIRSRK